MDPLAIAWAFLKNLCYVLSQNGQAWACELNVKSRNCVPKADQWRQTEDCGQYYFSRSLRKWIRWNYGETFRTATSGYWSILVPVSKKYDKAGKRFSQSTDLLGQVSFSCLASPFVFVSLSSWYLTKVHNDGQLLTTQKGLVLVRGPSPFLHSTEVSTPLWIPSLEPTSTSTHAAPHSCLATCLKTTVLGTLCSITKLKPALSNRPTDRQCCISSGRANVTLPRRAEHPLPGTPTSHNWGHYVQKPGSILYHLCRLPPSCLSWQYAFFSLLGGSVGDWSTPTRLHWGTPGNEDVFCESGFTK